MSVPRSNNVSALGLALTMALPLSIPSVVRADDDDHYHHRHGLFWHYHNGNSVGHPEWIFVVPHRHNYVGAYYSIGKVHYYTPAPIVPLVPNAPPPAAVQAQKPVELRYGGFERHSDLGGRLVYEANALCLEMHYNYRNNPGFKHVYDETYDILKAAKYIHAKEHQDDRQAIREQAAAVDRLFHHVQEEIVNWKPTGNRRVGGDDLFAKIGEAEAIIHHLNWEVGIEPHVQERAPAPDAPVDPNQPAPPPDR